MVRGALVAVALILLGAGRADAALAPDWRGLVVPPGVSPPPAGPLLALVDTPADTSHPVFAGADVRSTGTPFDAHGTAMASVAIGVWPRARVLVVPVDLDNGCTGSGAAIEKAVAAGASVIGLSYGSPARCASEWVQVAFAAARDIVVVAAAGNAGNPHPTFPGALEHVVTVAGTDAAGTPPAGAIDNTVDLAAPSENILAAAPLTIAADGYAPIRGSGGAMAMVASLALWLRAGRPELTADQVAGLLRHTARDLGAPGRDSATGWGWPRIQSALADRAPTPDAAEPDDNVVWVNGSASRRPARAVAETVSGRLHRYEDAVDVHRVLVAPHSSRRVTVEPRWGDPDIAAFASDAVSVTNAAHRVGRSAHPGSREEQLVLRNDGRRSRVFYVAVSIRRSAPDGVGYRLRLSD